MSHAQLPEALRVPQPQSPPTAHAEVARQYLLNVPKRFMDKCRELEQMRRKAAQQQSQIDYAIRNLIGVLDTCQEVAQAQREESPPTIVPPPVIEAPPLADGAVAAEPVPPATSAPAAIGGEQSRLQHALGASVERQVTDVLEQLGVVQIDLLGATYETVRYQGRKVEDPFEIVATQQQGSARKQKVVEVISSLWIRFADGKVKVVRPGKVNC